jgi:predicted nucleic acid-binding protein
MPTGADRRPRAELLVDTSVAVALLVADHEHHRATHAAVGSRSLGLAGHAAYETYSVLTRLPPPARRPSNVVAALLEANFPGTAHLSPERAEGLIGALAAEGIGGGAVYDALVGATAAEHGIVLATRDRRAVDTYRALGVDVEVLAS